MKNNNNSSEKLVLLATTIAIELFKNKTPEEQKDLKVLLGHIYSTFCSLMSK